MNLEIKQDILMEYLNYVIRGISTKNIIPILNCIKFELNNEGLYLTSTDSESAIKTFIPTEKINKIISIGDIVISGKYIFDIIRKLPNEIIKIEETVDNKINISTTNSSFDLNCNNVNEFPELDLSDSKTPIYVNRSDFKSLIKQTSFAASTQENRPEFTGINLKIEDNKLEFTATDSYRLAKKEIELVEVKGNLEHINIIIPTKNLNELEKMITDNEDQIELHIFNNKIIFKFDNILMMSRLINGTYPDTNKLIPTDFELILTVNLIDFYKAIDRASLLTSEYDKNTIKLDYKDNIVNISSNIPEIGHVEEKIRVNSNNENTIKLAFSSKYMLEALKTFECDQINIKFNGEEKPIIITNIENDGVIQLILPVKTY